MAWDDASARSRNREQVWEGEGTKNACELPCSKNDKIAQETRPLVMFCNWKASLAAATVSALALQQQSSQSNEKNEARSNKKQAAAAAQARGTRRRTGQAERPRH